MDKLTVYTTGPSCGKCSMTKMMLKGKGIPFVEVDITQNPAAHEYVTEELGYSMAPVVVVDDDDHWCDMRPDQIDRIAKRAILPSDATREARSPAR
ncbi:glutaredoxin domain-containing protein (plasmid) [Microbacterium proteolyticum]|uniref:glutaredoxin family protein n=1 Tax=Microbacterium proteolyticum TaxID=1572644 RepID=UPI002415F6D9|nr:glutaredoxin domain-containing protein [Microbacterium proteolyticum]